jgi:hypothetical protein
MACSSGSSPSRAWVYVTRRIRHFSFSTSLGTEPWFLTSAILPAQLLERIWPWTPLSFVIALAAFSLLVRSKNKEPLTLTQASAAVSAISLLFMLFSKKTYPSYAPMYLLFTCFVVSRSLPRSKAPLLALMASASLGLYITVVWNALGQPDMFKLSHVPLGNTGPTAILVILLALLNLIICAANSFLLWVSIRMAVAQSSPLPSPRRRRANDGS